VSDAPDQPADGAAAPRRVTPGHPAPRRALARDASGSVRAAQPARGAPLSVAEAASAAPRATPSAEGKAGKKGKGGKPGKDGKAEKDGKPEKGGKPHKHPKDGAGKGGRPDRDAAEAGGPAERSGVLVLPWPKANRKRLERRAAEHGMSPEQLAYQVLDVWLDDGR
jgi:hypothetical protein